MNFLFHGLDNQEATKCFLIITQIQVLYLTTLRKHRTTETYHKASMPVTRYGIEVCTYLFVGKFL